jgi:1,4-alpha-glucan branching enzyme
MDEKAWIKKQYLKSKPICKVTFRLPKEGALAAETVTVVGEFNNWDEKATPMKLQKNGDFMVVLELEKDKEYRFRYCIDSEKWENDWCADKYEPNPFGGFDSVVVV